MCPIASLAIQHKLEMLAFTGFVNLESIRSYHDVGTARDFCPKLNEDFLGRISSLEIWCALTEMRKLASQCVAPSPSMKLEDCA